MHLEEKWCFGIISYTKSFIWKWWIWFRLKSLECRSFEKMALWRIFQFNTFILFIVYCISYNSIDDLQRRSTVIMENGIPSKLEYFLHNVKILYDEFYPVWYGGSNTHSWGVIRKRRYQTYAFRTRSHINNPNQFYSTIRVSNLSTSECD